MKRFISLLLTVLLLLTSVNTLVFAAVKEKTFNAASDIYSLVEGEGFHDNKSAAGRRGLEIDGTSVVLRQNEWICYDISDLEGGVYKLSINSGVKNPVTVAVEIDGTEVLSNISVTSSGDYSTPSDFEFGEITLSGSQEKLKIKNTTTNRAMYVNTITLKKLDPLTFKSFSSNADAESAVVARGADSFTINMSADLNPDTVKNETVMIKDSDGNALDANVSASGSVITLNLKESLDFSSDYTIYIDGVKAFNGQSMDEPASHPFETADEADMKGTATIEVTSFEAKDGTVSAEGVVKSSKGLGISGREVRLFTKGENETDESLAKTSVSGENGAFAVSYSMPDNSDAGRYEVKITSDYVGKAYIGSLLYFSEALGEEIKTEFSNLAELTDVETAINTYKDYLGIDLEWVEDVISDSDKVYDDLLGKTFEDAASVINTLKEAVYFEAMLQTVDEEVIVEILDDEAKNEYVKEINISLWDVLSDSSKSSVASKAIDFAADEFADSLNAEIKAQIISQLGIVSSEISFTSDEIMTGKTAEITASIDENISDVCGMHFEFAYDAKSASFFENEEVTVEAPKGMEYKTEVKDNVLYIDLTAQETVSVSGDFMTVKIPASGKAGGIHTSTVSGYIVYHPEVITDENENLYVDCRVVKNPSVTVDVVKSMTIKAPDVINLIEGEGFHNEASLGGKDGLDVSGNTVIYRTGEWGVYDISSLAEGKYEFSLRFSSSATTTFVIDAEGKNITKTFASTGGYNTYLTQTIGIVEVDGLQKTFKFKNTGTGSSYVEKIMIERVDAPEIVEITTNAGIDGDVIPRGADRLNIKYNNVLNADTVIAGAVTMKDEDGKSVEVTAFATGGTISVDLKETLEFNKEYTITVNGVVDRFAQAVSDEITVKTDGEDNTSGSSSIDIDTWKVSGREFKAEGSVLSSSGVGIKGRKLQLTAKAPEGKEYVLWAEGISGKDGKFSIEYTFANDAVSGKYSLVLSYEYAKASYKNNAYYFDNELSESLADEFSGIENTDAVISKLEDKAEILGINLEEIKDNVSLKYIANKLVNKNYETAGEILDDINKYYALEKVNQAFSEDSVLSLIDDEDALKEIGDIQRDKWNALSDEEKMEIAKAIKSGGRIEEPVALLEKIDELINGTLQERYNIDSATVSVSSATVNVGQSAEIIFTADTKQENVVGICIEIEYTEDEAKLLEDSVSYTLSKDLKNMTVNKTAKEGKIIFELSAANNSNGEVKKVSFRNDIITLSFKAPTDSEGTYNPKVSGYITYHTDTDEEHQTEAYFVDIPFAVSENPVITVEKIKETGNKDYSGGGGASGGNSYGTQGAGSNLIPPVTSEGLNVDSAFSDIDNIAWAKDSIEALALKGIINGRGDGTFAPNESVTRAEFCKMITSAFGVVKNDAVCEFADVASDSWFYTYVASAKAAGLVNGKTETGFAPSDTITREEMAAIALRALGKEASKDVTVFADDEAISAYAKDAVYTLKNLGILDGVGDNMFAPRSVVTRAMAAKVIYALMTV